MIKQGIITLELHGPTEAYALVTAIYERIGVLGNSYIRSDVIEFIVLQQIAARIEPQVDALVEQEERMNE